MLFGGVVCFEMSTPWFAFKYDEEKSTVRFRWAVIVASWNEMSNFFVPGREQAVPRRVHPDRRQAEALRDRGCEIDLVARAGS